MRENLGRFADRRSKRLGQNPRIQIDYSKTSAGKESSLSKLSIVSLLVIFDYSSVVAPSSEMCIVSTGQKNSWYQQRRYSENTDGET